MKVIFMRACMREAVRSTKERKFYIKEISSEVFTREKENCIRTECFSMRENSTRVCTRGTEDCMNRNT